MKRTILATVVAMSFAGFAQAADELSLYDSVDGVKKNEKSGQWEVTNKLQLTQATADATLVSFREKEHKTYLVSKYKNIAGTGETDLPKEQEFNELAVLVTDYTKPAEETYNLSRTAYTEAVKAVKSDNDLIAEQRIIVATKTRELAQAKSIETQINNIHAGLAGGTQDFVLPDGSIVTISDAGGAKATFKHIGNELVAEVGSDYDFAGIVTSIDGEKTTASGLISTTTAGLATRTSLVTSTKGTMDANKVLLDKQILQLHGTSLYSTYIKAKASYDSAESGAIAARLVEVEAANAEGINNSLDELKDLKIIGDDIATVGKDGKTTVITDAATSAVIAKKGVVANNHAIRKVADYAVDNRGRIVKNETNIKANTDGIAKNKADIKDLRMDFNKLSADFYEFKSEASKGIAGVAAMSQMDSVYAAPGEYFVGAGVGGFNGESAVAVGMGYRYSENMSYRAAVSFASGDATPVWGAGATYTFK